MATPADLLREEVRARPEAAHRLLRQLRREGWQVQATQAEITRLVATRGETVIVAAGPNLGEAAVTLYRRTLLFHQRRAGRVREEAPARPSVT